MQLHQLLRHIHDDVPILLFDLKGYQVCYVLRKSDINVDLYEYVVLDINVGSANSGPRKAALYITLEK